MQSALAFRKKEIRNTADSDQVVNSLKLDWEKILLAAQKDLYEDVVKQIQCTTETYCEALLRNLEDRFPEPQILFTFRIFDTKEIPPDANQRQLYGNQDLKLLIKWFKVASDKKIFKVVNDHQTLKDRIIMPEFEFCLHAIDVCSKSFRDKIFQKIFPEFHLLCCIALSIPLATAWPERGFSTKCRVKSKQRNRLLDVILNALINVSMNGPNHLDAPFIETFMVWVIHRNIYQRVEVAQNRITAKNGREVKKRALQTMMSADDM